MTCSDRLRTTALLASAMASALLASTASAHICLDVPTSREAAACQTHDFLEAAVNTQQKIGPCGSTNGRSSTPTVFRPGETITVKWTETIDHNPSWYRISVNPNGDSFEDPTSYEDKTGAHPYTLLDGIQDGSAAAQEVRVTLPNRTCENCTLQLIQVMGDKGGNGFGGNDGEGGKADNDDLYYACADIALRGVPVSPGQDAGLGGQDAGLGGSDASVVPPSDAGTPSPAPDGGSPIGTAGGLGGGTTSGSVGGAGAGGGTGNVAGGATAGTGSSGGTTGATGGATGTLGGAGGSIVGMTPAEGVVGEDDGGCECAVSGSSPRYGNLFGMLVVAIGLLFRRRASFR